MIDFSCKKFELSQIIKCSFNLTKGEVSLFYHLRNIKQGDDDFICAQTISEELSVDITTIQKGLKKLFDAQILTRMQKNLDSGGYVYLYQMKSKQVVSELIMSKVKLWVSKVEEELLRD